MWRAKRARREKRTHVCRLFSLCADTDAETSTSLSHCQHFHFFPVFTSLRNDEQWIWNLKCYLSIVVFTTNGPTGRNQGNMEVLVWGNILLNCFPKKWLEFLVLNMPNEQNKGMTKRHFPFYSLFTSLYCCVLLFHFFSIIKWWLNCRNMMACLVFTIPRNKFNIFSSLWWFYTSKMASDSYNWPKPYLSITTVSLPPFSG